MEEYVTAESQDFTLSVQPVSMGVVLHCQVRRWSKTVYLQLLECYLDIVDMFGAKRVYAIVPEGDLKLGKFCEMFNLAPFDWMTDREGNKVGELYSCVVQ